MKLKDKIVKRVFDFIISFLLLIALFFPILILIIISTIDTKLFGLFSQKRIGYKGVPFVIYKIRTLNKKGEASAFGSMLRAYKFDEYPQLFNVLIGEMSFVGPRPDVEGFADQLNGEDKIILSVKPGITGPASLKYRNEEELLKNVVEPQKYIKEVIFPDKVKINKSYVLNYSFRNDLRYLLKTIFFED